MRSRYQWARAIDEDRFDRDRAAICAELELRARSRLLITYGEAAGMVGRASQGLGRILDAIVPVGKR